MSCCVWTNPVPSRPSTCLAKQRLHTRPLQTGVEGSPQPPPPRPHPALPVRGFSWGAGCQHLSSCPQLFLDLNNSKCGWEVCVWGSFLSRNQGAECWKCPDPDHPVPSSWDNGSKPTDAKWETLRLLISLSPKSTKHPATGTEVFIQRKACHHPQIQIWSLVSEILPRRRTQSS